NLISGNNSDGIEFTAVGTSNNIVLGNLIGTTAGGTAALGNTASGINFTANAHSTQVGGITPGQGNVIAFNLDDGVSVAAGTNNTIRGNSIFANGNTAGDIGIDLGANGVTTNDVGDFDTGANQLQNFPVIQVVSNSVAGTFIGGTLNCASNQ